MRDIKQLKPSSKSRYDQGYINPSTCKKLFESQKSVPIIYRSSLEKKFVMWCENSAEVKRWGSECVKVRYSDPRDGTMHTYNPDFILEMTDGRRIVVEIKPYNQTKKPPYPPRDDYQWNTYIKNTLKWKAAREHFEGMGIQFMIITEKFFTRYY